MLISNQTAPFAANWFTPPAPSCPVEAPCRVCCDQAQLGLDEGPADLAALVPLLEGLLEVFSDLLEGSTPSFDTPRAAFANSPFAGTPAAFGSSPFAGWPAAFGNTAVQAPQSDVSSIEEANRHLVSQWGGTPTNAGLGGNAVPYGYSDCVPTSAVMALSALGLVPNPGPEGASQAIDAMRDASLGYDSTSSAPMGFGQVARGLEAHGASTNFLDHNDMSAIDAALARGNPVMVAGNPWRAWGQAEHAKGNYLNTRDPGPHAMTLLGRTADGLYIMADPLFRNTTILVSADQLRMMFADGGAEAGAMEVSR